MSDKDPMPPPKIFPSVFNPDEIKKLERSASIVSQITALSTEYIEECFESAEDRHTAAFVFAIQMAVYSLSQFKELEEDEVKKFLSEFTAQIHSQYRCSPSVPPSRLQ